MIVVSNTTPLIGLAAIGHFDLLPKILGQIVIPQAVYNEAVVYGREQGGARDEVMHAPWIKVQEAQDRLAVDVLLDELDLGEAETIVLAQELQADLVLMDERKGRRKLDQLGLKKIGTLGLLLRAKELGLMPAIRPEIERLRETGFSISDRLVAEVLRTAGE